MVRDFNFGKIYKIVGSGMTYYGSTTNPVLAYRLSSHVSAYKNWKDAMETDQDVVGYCACMDIIDGGEYGIHLVEDFPCENAEQLCEREQYYIDNNECVNKRRSYGVSIEEVKQKRQIYYKANREGLLQYHKEYREANKVAIAEHAAEKVQCECGAFVARGDIARHRESEKHKNPESAIPMTQEQAIAKRRESVRNYYTRNKETLNQKKQTAFECECGGKYKQQHYATHCNTKMHIKFITDNSSASPTN